MGNQSLGWSGRNQHSWYSFMPLAKPRLLYKDESIRKSDFPQAKWNWKVNLSKRCSTLLPVHQPYPFCQSVLEEKLVPWPCVLPSQPFWEAVHTASPYPYQILHSVVTSCCLLMKDPINRASLLLIQCFWALLLVYSPDCKLKGEQWLRARKKSLNLLIMQNWSCVN